MQRRAQLVIDEPIQYFFATSFALESPERMSQAFGGESATVQDYLDDFAKVGELKVHLFPEAEQGSILIRLANMADLFDGTPSATPYFDLHGYLVALYT